MDLDKLILQKQNEAMHQNTLDIDWMTGMSLWKLFWEKSNVWRII